MKPYQITKYITSISAALVINHTYAESVEVLTEKGVFLEETKKDYAAAITTFDQAIAAEKKRSKLNELLYRKAMCHKELGKTEKHLTILRQLSQSEDKNNVWVKKAQKIIQEQKKKDAPSQEVIATRDTILKATENNDLKLLHSVCDEKMTAAMTKTVLDGVSDQLEESLAKGYETTVIQAITKRVYDIYIWRVNCKDGTEFNMTMTLNKKGKVAGCLFK